MVERIGVEYQGILQTILNVVGTTRAFPDPGSVFKTVFITTKARRHKEERIGIWSFVLEVFLGAFVPLWFKLDSSFRAE